MRAIETIKNIWKIEDLRKRILITLLLVLIYRFGTYIVLPGIDPKDLTALGEQTRGGLMALLDMFSGGGFLERVDFCLGNHALYLCFDCDAVGGNCDSFVPEDAA